MPKDKREHLRKKILRTPAKEAALLSEANKRTDQQKGAGTARAPAKELSRITEEDCLARYRFSSPQMDSAMKLFLKAFKGNVENLDVERSVQLAHSIADALNDMYPREYAKYTRSKFHNLNMNSVLCKKIYDGEIRPMDFVTMTAEEMKSEELKLKDSISLKNTLLEAQTPVAIPETNLHTCPRCKGKECSYRQLQTRSGDEPMTTFLFCTLCKYRWRKSS